MGVELWQEDEARRGGRRRRKERSSEEEVLALRREVLALLGEGKVGKAMRRVTSHGLADPQDPDVARQLREKFPDRQQELPASVPRVARIEAFRGLRETLLALEPGTSPGSGGLRPEFLVALGESMEDEEVEVLERLGMAYVSGDLPPWFYRLWLSLQTVPMYKTAQQSDVRPLGVRHTLTRVFHREVATQNKEEVREYLEPQQLGLSQAGAGKLVNSIRGLLALHPDWVCVGADVKNCFNEFSRKAVLDVILTAPELAHLATFSAAILAPDNPLESGGAQARGSA